MTDPQQNLTGKPTPPEADALAEVRLILNEGFGIHCGNAADAARMAVEHFKAATKHAMTAAEDQGGAE